MLILVSNCGELFVKGEFRLSSNSKSRVPQNNTPSIASTNKLQSNILLRKQNTGRSNLIIKFQVYGALPLGG